MTDQALEELAFASKTASASPRVNLSTAKIYQWREDNLAAFNTLRKSFPDYSQMQPEEMTRDEWAIFYPLAYWDTIVHESKAKGLDPYQVAGLIRQETVFNPKARSPARAYGLMQLLVPTATLVSKRYNTSGPITAEALYEPKLNIQLGTAYFRDQMDKYGRIEFVTAAYNAGPHRVEEWKVSLPSDMDEWAESVPFKETRSYIQGVVRNTLQYRRLYDETGQFRPIVGTRANRGPGAQPADATVRQRRISGNEREE
jgi:soluble lytic murein transglycosylase